LLEAVFLLNQSRSWLLSWLSVCIDRVSQGKQQQQVQICWFPSNIKHRIGGRTWVALMQAAALGHVHVRRQGPGSFLPSRVRNRAAGGHTQ
jgi:hypothetical protein